MGPGVASEENLVVALPREDSSYLLFPAYGEVQRLSDGLVEWCLTRLKVPRQSVSWGLQ
ncbi:hypothetical protein TRAPUB_4229 [Trametes pubescens]|uniref:Uncharacterized protein n=1 Tax=Trametes pubescens TaxID=154538 RepID=A0A1M2VBF4_TRAPU|nr:hypothetical protein TRAPUB_4229 [Trametes pubescens]